MGVVIALGVVSAAVGLGMPAAVTHLRQVTAWLESSNGTVTRVDGLSGRADARVAMPGGAGHQLKVMQDGATVLVEDDTTGTVTRIDPAQLSVTQSADLSGGDGDDQVVTGYGLTYVVDLRHGSVQRIDPVKLSAIGAPVAVGGGSAIDLPGIDSSGTLWVPVPADGDVVPIAVASGGQPTAATPVAVGVKQDQYAVTVVGGTAVITDATAGVVAIAPPHAAVVTVNLPGGLASNVPHGLLVPSLTEGRVLPLLNLAAGQLALVNTATGAPSAVGLGALAQHDLGAPVEHGGRIYLPDQTTGALDVYDEASGRMLDPIPVTGQAGTLEVFVKDGILWANAPDGADALTIDTDGVVHQVGKYDPEVPGTTPSPSSASASVAEPTTVPSTVRTSGDVASSSSSTSAPLSPARPGPPSKTVPVGRPTTSIPVPTTPPSTKPSKTPTPTPTTSLPPPQAPGSPKAQANAGWIDVIFSPSSGTTPTSYTLLAPSGATVQPAQIPPTGPFKFKVTGLPCVAQQYPFTVEAMYPGGKVPSQQTAPVRPCLAPGAPTGVTVTASAEHAIGASWTAPSSDGGGSVTYDVAWSGAKSGDQPGVTGTSYQISGLTNFQNYTVSVTAANAAGSSTPPSTGSGALNGKTYGSNIYNNSALRVNLRQNADRGSTSLGSFPITPVGQLGTPVTVLCQVTGTQYSDPTAPSVFYHIWDKVNALGQTGYVGDLYVHTPQSAAGNYNSFSDPPIWNCN